ncbi:hypothetical protein GCM10027190_45600 [Spirosoma areae]
MIRPETDRFCGHHRVILGRYTDDTSRNHWDVYLDDFSIVNSKYKPFVYNRLKTQLTAFAIAYR